MHDIVLYQPKPSWNKGKLVGQKLPLKLEQIWFIRTRLDISNNLRELTMFNLALDSKLRACDFIKLKVRDIAHGTTVQSRAILIQQKTGRPVQILLGHTKLESTIRYLGIEVDDALEISAHTDI